MAAAAQDVFRVVDDSIARGGHGVRSDACARLYQPDGLGRQTDDGDSFDSAGDCRGPGAEINGDSGEGSYHGVFVAAGPEPTKEELADARKRLEAFQTRLVEPADLEWERSHNMMFITDLERRAARELHVDDTGLDDP